jgi:ribonuclease P protein component
MLTRWVLLWARMGDQRFPKSLHLLKQAEFDRVFASRAYAADDQLIVHGCLNGLPVTRLGLSVSRKSGNAVTRNYWKRCIREAFRLNREQLPIGLDLVVRPQRGAVANSAAIHKSLPALVRRLKKRLSSPPRESTNKPAEEKHS